MASLFAMAGGLALGMLWDVLPPPWRWALGVLALAGGPAAAHRFAVGPMRVREGGAGADAPAREARAPTPSEEQSRLLDILGNLGLAVVLTDQAGTVIRTSRTAAEILQCEGRPPRAALDLGGTFFGVQVEDAQQLAPMHRFFNSEDDTGEGVVTCAGSRRHLYWAGRVLAGTEGFGLGRLFMIRDVTAERRFEVMKSDFLATVSHELRTPLTSLRGSLQLVLGRADTLQKSERDLLGIGVKSTERLIRLINDLLDVDRLEQGTIAFQFATTDVRELIAAAVNATAGACAARNLRVKVSAPDSLPAVYGDRERLAQVLVNLIDNAARFAPPSSPIVVGVHVRDAGIQIDVADRGPGIPAAERPHVFERFWRADRSTAEGGTGLGLAICRAIVVRHGGHIWLDSEEGQGSTFSVLVPRSIFRRQAEEAPAADPDTPSPVVLVIEDDPDTRAVTRASLELHGYEVVEAGNGAQGVAVARREQPAAILLDVKLPDIDGYDVLRVLKNSPDSRAIPVVVLSIDAERSLARRLGAADSLQKPARFEAVRASLARAIRRARQPEGRLVLGLGPAASRDLAMLARALERDCHEIYRARDIADLARWSSAHYPDLLVLDDDVLPGTRAEAAEMLRHPVSGVHVPLVFLATASDGDGAAGGWSRLRKPISKDEFIAAAQRLVAAG